MTKEISLNRKTEIIKLYLEGLTAKEIGKKFGICLRSVNLILSENPNFRLDIEKKLYAVHMARENRRIMDIKDNALKIMSNSLEKILDKDSEEMGRDDIYIANTILNNVDRMYRLNNETPTEINENRDKIINYSEVIKNLKTPEEKKEFLFKQLENKNG